MARTRHHVVVAMSGGVDSSVAAALLAEEGHEVTGVMMHLWAEGPVLSNVEGPVPSVSKEPAPSVSEGTNRCCTPEAVDDARRVAEQLGIPFHLVDYEAEFKGCVVDYFI
ncbi:asparagine synthase-related protein, partial [Chloroflexota bacterium]